MGYQWNAALDRLYIVVQMASPSATFILESVVRGHHIYKLDVGYRRRLMVVLSTIDNNKLIAYL